MHLVDIFGIKNFRGVFARNALPSKPRRGECGIINLDDSFGGGTHWVAYRNSSPEYYDSFGLPPPKEILNYLGPRTIYSSDESQDRDSVLCGWWCLYFLIERQKGTSFLDVIHPPKIGRKFIITYFGL